MEQPSSNDIGVTIRKILDELADSNVSLNTKYKRQNELKRIAASNQESFLLVQAALKQDNGFMYRKLALDCELEALNFQYLFDLVVKAAEPSLVKYGLSKYYHIFKQETPFTDPDTLVSSILPSTPFTIRNLILRNIARNYHNQSTCENLYQAIEKCLDPNVANILLPGCSAPFVADVLKGKKHIRLNPKQFNHLLKKHPELAIEYLKDNTSRYPYMVQRIIKIDAAAFAEIYETNAEYLLYKDLSPTDTKLLFKTCFDRVLENAKIYTKILHSWTLFRVAGKETYIQFLVRSLPSSLEEFDDCEYNTVPFVGRLPTNVDKGELFKQAFKVRYGTSLTEYPSCISQSILELFSPSDRDHYSDLKLNLLAATPNGLCDSTKKSEWLAYKSIEKSIPAIKGLVAKESDHFRRQRLLCSLIKTCRVNRDGAALSIVCKYYVDRHRNERSDTHARFIYDISNDFEGTNLVLDPDALDCFVELFKLYMINLDSQSYIEIPETLLEKIFFAQVDNNISTDWIVSILIRTKLAALSSWRPYWTFSKARHLNERCLSLMGAVVAQMETLSKTRDEWAIYIIAILSWCRDWNRNVSRSKNLKQNLPHNLDIKRFPKLEGKIADIFNKMSEVSTNLQGRFILALLQNSALSLDDPRLKSIPEDETLVLYLLKHNISAFNSNWKTILNSLFALRANYLPIAVRLRQNGYTCHLSQIQNEFYLKVKDDTINTAEKFRMVGLASLAFSTEDFLTWIENYYPTSTDDATASTDPETFMGIMAIRRGICQYLKNVDNPTQALPPLLKFCGGDSLKLVLGSLFSIVVNAGLIPVQKLLMELCQRPAVSVKKHGIRLLAMISLKDGFCKLLMDLWANDKHPTTRTVIMTAIIERLQFDEMAWISLQEALPAVSVEDKELMMLLSSCSTLPAHLVEQYGTLLWNKYQSDPKKQLFSQFVSMWMNTYFEQLSATWILAFLDKEPLLEEMVEEDETRILDSVAVKITAFWIRGLFKFPGEQGKFIAILNKNLKRAVEPFIGKWPQGLPTSSFKMFVGLIKMFCRYSFSHEPEKNLKMDDLKMFLEIRDLSVFSNNTGAPELLSMHFFLKVTEVMHANKNQTVVRQGQLFGQLLDYAIGKYGNRTFPLWAKHLRTFISDIWGKGGYAGDQSGHEFKLDLAAGLLKSCTVNVEEKMILALTLMPETKPKDEQVKEKYYAVLKEISASDSHLVKTHFVDWALQM